MTTNRQRFVITASAVALVCVLILTVSRQGEIRSEAPGETKSRSVDPHAVRPATVSLPAAGKAPSKVSESGTESVEARIVAVLAKRVDSSDPEARRELVDELRRLELLRAEQTATKARELGLPLVTEAGAALVRFDGEMPLYDISHNAYAAISTTSDVLRLPPYNVDGKDRKIGLWDVLYAPNEIHQELEGEIDIRDDATPGGLHATHVAATMIGKGIDWWSTGMAPKAKIWAYSSTDMLPELAAAASVDAGDFGKLMVSVHPYGTAAGWEYDGREWYGTFSDDGDPSNDYAPLFGQYSSTTATWDGLAKTFPYHLMVKSSGNHADDNPPQYDDDDGEEADQTEASQSFTEPFGGGFSNPYNHSSSGSSAYWSLNGTSTWYEYDDEDHPEADGKQFNASRDGFGTIDARAGAKNILTVGSVSDAVTGGLRDLSAANLSRFSSAGPTDDGRIKPDVVANGESVYSADGWSTDSYFQWSGTSMAAASAGGTALLLVDLQKDLSGVAMRASTLKGLLIHTADDLGNPGPDYRHGWGLINAERAAQLLVDHEALKDIERARLMEETILSESDNDYYVIDHDGASPLRLTLCWTDEAGDWTSGHDNRTPRLVNDLSLCLAGPDATVYHPYVMPFSTSFDEADLNKPAVTGVNKVDNVEQIFLPNAPAGQYIIQVNLAGALTGSMQEYSLLLSGSTLPGPGVELENPVPDQSYLVLNTSKIDDVADPKIVFSGQDHTYGFSLSPEGLCTGVFGSGGKLDLYPTTTAYGTVAVTLTALDASGGFASDTFNVTLRPAQMFVNMSTPAAPAEQDGATWATAYRYLQDGLAGAVEGQEIWVAQGIYYPDVDKAGDTDGRDRTFAMVPKVPMYGGFVGGETTREERDPYRRPTILSGDIAQDDSLQPIATRTNPQYTGDWNNSYRVVDMTASEDGDILDGFVITAGRADVWPDNVDGAGVYCLSAVSITNCWITGNYVANDGAGLYVFADNPIISKCRLNGNEAGNAGGGVYARNGAADFYNCEIRGNKASDGGGLYLENPDLDLLNCVISGNNGFFGGGGIHMAGGKLVTVNCTVTGNTTFGAGGALKIVAAAEKPKFRNVIMWDNQGGGSTTTPVASVHFADPGDAPKMSNCIVANSGGSVAWNGSGGIDEGGNVDLDPLFVSPHAPSSMQGEGGDFNLQAGSAAMNGGLLSFLLADRADLDGDGDTGEDVEVDLAGNTRVVSVEIDLGAYEFSDLNLLDSDFDGLSDQFEMTYGGDLTILDPMSDLDADGMTALAEFVHGEDPTAPFTLPPTAIATMDYLGTTYLTVTFNLDPVALNFATIAVERRGRLDSPLGWQENQTIEVSAVPSPTRPGLMEVTYRSQVPFGQDRAEFMRLRHEAR